MTKTNRPLTLPIILELGRDRFRLVDPADIYYLQASDDDVLVKLRRGRPLRDHRTLGDIERDLPTPPFFRIHRGYIGNLGWVQEIRRKGSSSWEVKMKPPVNKLLPVSRDRWAGLKRLLGG